MIICSVWRKISLKWITAGDEIFVALKICRVQPINKHLITLLGWNNSKRLNEWVEWTATEIQHDAAPQKHLTMQCTVKPLLAFFFSLHLYFVDSFPKFKNFWTKLFCSDFDCQFTSWAPLSFNGYTKKDIFGYFVRNHFLLIYPIEQNIETFSVFQNVSLWSLISAAIVWSLTNILIWN